MEWKFTKKIIFLDLETTGLDPVQNRITQIAALQDGLTRKFVTYVDAGVEIPEEITKLTGISNETVKGAPSEKEALEKLIEFLDNDYIIIAQNAPFDLGFLHHALIRNGLTPIVPNFMCTRTMAAVFFPSLSHRLTHMANLFDIEIKQEHDAFYDSEATMRYWHKLENIARFMGIDFTNKLVEHPDRPMAYVPPNAKMITLKFKK